MQMPVRIPEVDPLPLPGPVWLFKFLLLFTFTLHLIAMNCALAGGATVVFNVLRGRSPQHPFSRKLGEELAHMLPIFLSFTITLGVAALLFLQVLYGNLFYTSSILVGAFWISVIGLVIAAYYGYYYFDTKQGAAGSIVVAAFSVLCLLCVAFIFSNNMTLVLTPSRWLSLYRAHPNGFNLNLGERSLLPRYLHMLVGAGAVFAAVLSHLGIHRRKKDPDYSAWIIRRSSEVFAAATGVEIVIGTWFLLSLPRSIALYFLSNAGAASLLGVALLCALAAMILTLVGGHTARPAPFVNSGFALTLVTVTLMVIMRQMLRSAFLHPYARPESLKVVPQTGIILLFFTLFVIGLATVAYMVRLLMKSEKKNSKALGQQIGA